MRTCDLSGMGGAYEAMCQRMLARGVAYLAAVKPPTEMWNGAKTFATVYGVMLTDGEALKALEAAVIRPGDDCTGAMHQCVMGHLRYIHAHGHDAWLAELAKHREPGDFSDYAGDGT